MEVKGLNWTFCVKSKEAFTTGSQSRNQPKKQKPSFLRHPVQPTGVVQDNTSEFEKGRKNITTSPCMLCIIFQKSWVMMTGEDPLHFFIPAETKSPPQINRKDP